MVNDFQAFSRTDINGGAVLLRSIKHIYKPLNTDHNPKISLAYLIPLAHSSVPK